MVIVYGVFLAILALQGWVLHFLFMLEKRDCECAVNAARVATIAAILLSCTFPLLFRLPSKKARKAAVIAFPLVLAADAVASLWFVWHAKKAGCACSADPARTALEALGYVKGAIVTLGVIVAAAVLLDKFRGRVNTHRKEYVLDKWMKVRLLDNDIDSAVSDGDALAVTVHARVSDVTNRDVMDLMKDMEFVNDNILHRNTDIAKEMGTFTPAAENIFWGPVKLTPQVFAQRGLGNVVWKMKVPISVSARYPFWEVCAFLASCLAKNLMDVSVPGVTVRFFECSFNRTRMS